MSIKKNLTHPVRDVIIPHRTSQTLPFVYSIDNNQMIDQLQSTIASLLIKKMSKQDVPLCHIITTYNEYSHGVPDQTIVFMFGGANFRAILHSVNNAVNSLIEQLKPCDPVELCIQVTAMPPIRKSHTTYALEIHMGHLTHPVTGPNLVYDMGWRDQ